MRRFWLSLAMLLAWTAAIGCRHPVQVCTDAKLQMVAPVQAQVSAHLGTPDRGPLEQVLVERIGRAPACKVALVDVDGLLVNAKSTGPYAAGENPVALLREKLDAAAADPAIRAVVLRINTAGGGVTATDLMWNEVRAFRTRTGIPVVACLMDLATGGGYYLATAADLIYAHPTTVTGAIGVVFNHYNLQDTLAQQSVRSEPIKAGDHVDMGTVNADMPPEVRDWLQGMADEYHRRFVEVVLSRRPQVPRDDPQVFDGRVFTAQQAKQRGLVDRIGYLHDAVAAACQLAGQHEAAVVMFRRPGDPARSPFAVTANQAITGGLLPISIPGLERSRLPQFMYIWLAEPTLDRLAGR